MGGWPGVRLDKILDGAPRNNPWRVLESLLEPSRLREGGGAQRDRMLHRWRLLELAEKTGQSVEQVAARLGLGESF